MDETEVQVEIACWAQDHPEASMINWTNGNEPWVTFEGKRCNVHVGLGGLTWSIEVPSGYQTEVDPRDGKRKRLWEPLDYHDVVIVQSKSTPFYVSVIDHAKTTLCVSPKLQMLQEFSRMASFRLSLSEELGEELVAVGKMEDGDKQHQKTPDMIKSFLKLQLREVGKIEDWLHQLNPGGQWPSSQDAQEARASLKISNACFASLKAAETLAEVLDSIHILSKLYNNSHRSSVNNTIGAAGALDGHGQPDELDIEAAVEGDGDILECNEDDEHLFDTELAIKWSWISAQVSYSQLACTAARQRAAMHCSVKSDEIHENESSSTATTNYDSFHHDVAANASCPGHSSNVQDVESNIEEILDPFQVLQCDSDSDCSDISWEMTDFCDSNIISKAKDACRDVQVEDSAPSLDGLSMQSTSKLEDQETHLALISSKQSEFSGTKSSKESIRIMPSANHSREPLEDGLDSGPSAKADEESGRNMNELEFCEIVFNPVSFSVECTIHLREFMNNSLTAAALGLSLDHPLRVEIVPKKAEVDSLQWTGAVDVYVSQQTDWHNHLSEEICGLLCFVPYIVQKFFFSHLSNQLRTHEEPKGELFIGVLETIVSRLAKVDDGNSCCVCARPADRPSQLYMTYKCLWPCTEDLCQATYATWQNVSSVDSQERDMDERFSLRSVEERLRDDFPYDRLEGLKSALHVYDVNTDQMNYGQLIRALASIEMWDEKDPDTPAADLMLFSEQGPVK